MPSRHLWMKEHCVTSEVTAAMERLLMETYLCLIKMKFLLIMHMNIWLAFQGQRPKKVYFFLCMCVLDKDTFVELMAIYAVVDCSFKQRFHSLDENHLRFACCSTDSGQSSEWFC